MSPSGLYQAFGVHLHTQCPSPVPHRRDEFCCTELGALCCYWAQPYHTELLTTPRNVYAQPVYGTDCKNGGQKRARWSHFLCRSFAGTRWAQWIFIIKCTSVLHADGSVCTKEWECWRKEMKCRALGFSLAFQSSRGTRGNWIWAGCSDLSWWSGRDQVALVCLNQKYHLILVFPLSTGDREQSWSQPSKPATLMHVEVGTPAFLP